MSWRDERWRTAARRVPASVIALAAAALLAVSACTVQPLYSAAPAPASGTVTGSIGGDLSTIAIKPVGERVAQQVRNRLIFLFAGGKGQPATPRYTLDLSVTSISEPTANIQINRQNEPTAAILTTRATYRLTDATGKPFSQGNRQSQASYDVPRQEFAAVRARIDAENRSARELAELIRLAVAQDLARGPYPPPDTPPARKALFKLGCEDACSPPQPSASAPPKQPN
jgi:LPS-assembly lipoprotein